MAFTTKLDFSNNRQVKQRIETIQNLSGATTFGVPFSSLPTGPDLNTTGITSTQNNFNSTFSGNTGMTIYNWVYPEMSLAESTLSAITALNSGTTQTAGPVFTASSSTIIDGNLVNLTYTGVTYNILVSGITDLGGGNVSGDVFTLAFDTLSAGTIDFTGRTIWSDTSGITRTERLIVTNNPVVGYVLKCVDTEGMAEWGLDTSGSTSTSFSGWTGGTGLYSIKANNDTTVIASGNYSHAEGSNTTANGLYSHAEGTGTSAQGTGSHAEGQNTRATIASAHAEGSSTNATGIASHSEGNNTTSSGNFSHAEGISTKAIGANSHAEGSGTTSNAISSHAEGISTTTIGDGSHAEGQFTIAIGNSSHAEGQWTTASGNWSHAEGISTTASGDYSHAQGVNTLAYGTRAHAEGHQTTASGTTAHSEGSNTTAVNNWTHAEGHTSKATGQVSHAEGSGTTASGDWSHSEGNGTTASGNYSHAGGNTSTASGNTSFVHGSGSVAGGINTIVFGANITGLTDNTTYVDKFNIKTISTGTSIYNLGVDASGFIVSGGTSFSGWSSGAGLYSIKANNDTSVAASGQYSVAEGYQTSATANYSHAEGYQTTASGPASHAEGSSIAVGDSSHAEGSMSQSNGVGSHSEGGGTISSGTYSHAEGFATLAQGNYSHSEGRQTIASGEASHAEGSGSTAIGIYSHAEGTGTTASGSSSHAEGVRTTAIGIYSHAEGEQTTATGLASHAEGTLTIAGEWCHAEGYQTMATGDTTHAEGYLTVSIGVASHSEGWGTTSTGEASHSEGRNTTAFTDYSHAGGTNSIASGITSFIHSTNSLVTGARSVVLGGQNITGATADYVYVPSLNVKVVGSSAFVNDIRIDANGNLTTNTSDIRFKENINNIQNALTKIKQLSGVTYQWKDRNAGGDDLKLGFIAQDVKLVEPNLVFTNKHDGYMGIHIDGIIPLLVEAVKELANTTNNNTQLETQTILAEDNNIDLNFNGNKLSALGGGISVLHAINTDESAKLSVDGDGNWVTNNDLKPKALTIPYYTPVSTNDEIGDVGNITRDDNYLYVKTNDNKWKRTKLEEF